MLVGYAFNHDSGVHLMWNENTNRIIVSRDVIWLKRMYFERPTANPDMITEPNFTNEVREGDDNNGDESNGDEGIQDEENDRESIDNEEDLGEDTENEDENNDTTEPNLTEASRNVTTTRSGREIRPPPRLIEEIGNVTNAERNYLAHIIMM